MDLARINVLEELARAQIKYEPISDDEVKVRCPKHDDSTASASLNVQSRLWKCHAAGCSGKGDIITMLAYTLKATRRAVLYDITQRYGIDEDERITEVNPELIERYHANVWSAGPLLVELRKRGVTDDMIRSARIGYHDGRITIPVYDSTSRCINVRSYLPGAHASSKMRNMRGRGRARLYQVKDIEGKSDVWICGGELKALVVKHLVPEVAAISSTAGEGSWDVRWNDLMRDRTIYICMDVDEPGRAAARKLAGILLRTTQNVRVIDLPLDPARYPKGDINDYVASGATGDDLRRLMVEALDPRAKRSARDDAAPKAIDIRDLPSAAMVGERIEFEGAASAMDTSAYVVAKKVRVRCTRDQPQCESCPVFIHPDVDPVIEIDSSGSGLLDMITSSKKSQAEAMMQALNIPKCKVVQLEAASHYSIFDARVTPKLSLDSEEGGSSYHHVMVVDQPFQLNSVYKMQGAMYPHPETQQAVVIVNALERTKDSLDIVELSEEELDEMRAFQPEEWTFESVEEKLDDIYAYLSAEVTHIYDRRDLHAVMDLAWHSPLMFTFARRQVNGWMNVAVIGDSAQGKSETASSLLRHYRLGERTECKNATIAGMVGGLQQLGNRWYVSWGVIPTQDRRLVVLEEVKGMPIELISRMTDMRSSGIAEIPKIERQKTLARTRLIWVSNPRGSRSVSTYTFGIEALRELIGALEDVRRFDAAVVLSSSKRIDRTPPTYEREYSSDICRSLLLWAWTRRPDDICFENEHVVTAETERLMLKYSDEIPLLDKGTAHYKLARVAAAMATRTFSTEDGKLLIIRDAHVIAAARWLDKVYSGSELNYAGYSSALLQRDAEVDGKEVVETIETQKYPRALGEGLLYTDEFTCTDVQDWCGVDRDSAQLIISQLVRARGIRRLRRYEYVKTPSMIELLKMELPKIQNPKYDRSM